MGVSRVGAALGSRIRARREAQGWSQARLAEAVDLTPNYVGSLERGEALPTVQTLTVIARSLSTSAAELLGETTEVGNPRDGWLDDLVALARAVPTTQRRLVLALVRAVLVEHGEAAPGSRRQRSTRRKR